MKVLASDFDGTFCHYGTVSEENIQAVNQWRKDGNLFGFITGRDLRLMKSMLDQFSIPFDFLVCGSGATVYDQELNLMWRSTFEDGIVSRIYGEPMVRSSQHIMLSDPEYSWLILQDPASPFHEDGNLFTSITWDQAMNLHGINQISLAFPEVETARICAQRLNEKHADCLTANHNFHCIDITPKGINKCSALQVLLELYGWPPSQLLTVGDGENDRAMIREFHGFTVENASPSIQEIAVKTYSSVAELIEDQR